MNELLEYWKRQLVETQERMAREPFAGSRQVQSECIDNYRRWIAQAEVQLSADTSYGMAAE